MFLLFLLFLLFHYSVCVLPSIVLLVKHEQHLNISDYMKFDIFYIYIYYNFFIFIFIIITHDGSTLGFPPDLLLPRLRRFGHHNNHQLLRYHNLTLSKKVRSVWAGSLTKGFATFSREHISGTSALDNFFPRLQCGARCDLSLR